MDNLVAATPFARAVGMNLKSERLTLVDVGCAGGVHHSWLAFGEALRVYGFDPMPEEVEKLRAQQHPGEHFYECGYVGIGDDHPWRRASADRPSLQRNPWSRLAIDYWAALRTDPSAPERAPFSAGDSARPQTSKDLIVLPDFLDARGEFPVDFIKIDVDGLDLDVLHSLDRMLSKRRVLGLGVEVNFFGSADPACNTLHNIDRFLREQGFELFDLTRRRYCGRYLPTDSSLHEYPAETPYGRLLQGDAFYARDLSAPWNRELRASYSPDAILKSAAIFSLFSLPDLAAELLVEGAQLFDPDFVSTALDLLAAQAQPSGAPSSYREHLTAFRNRNMP